MRHYEGISAGNYAHFWYEKMDIGWVMRRESTLLGVRPYTTTVAEPRPPSCEGVVTEEEILNDMEEKLYKVAMDLAKKLGPA